MAEKILKMPVKGSQLEIQYVLRWQPTGRTAKRFAVVIVTDVFRILGYAEPSQSVSYAMKKAAEDGKRYARKPIMVKGVARTVVSTQDAMAMAVGAVGRKPAVVLAVLDALRAIEDAAVYAPEENATNENI